jgi:hypothetical protein
MLNLIAETSLQPIKLQYITELVSTNEEQKNLKNYLMLQIKNFK